MKILSRARQLYGDMKLKSKITVVLILAVTVPILMIGVFFYGRLYEMVVSYTIRQEQDASAETAPVIEDMVQEVLDAYDTLTSLPFYGELFDSQLQEPLAVLLSSGDADDFCRQAKELIDGRLITGIQIYLTLPDDSQTFFENNSNDIFAPLSSAKGTYWYGIFQGTNASELYCPSFYLGSQEQQRLGNLAYIRKSHLLYQGASYACYTAVYYSSEPLREILIGNLTLDGSVSYIMNDRDALVASSNESLSGIYWLDYTTIRQSFMSSNNFIERTILDATVYVGFYSISQPGWFMVTVLPSAPLILQSKMLMIQYIAMYIVFIILALILSSMLAHSVTNRISSVISQMRLVREGLPAPMENPSYHDEVGDLIDTYNYMTRKIDTLIEEQGKAAEELRISEFNSLQAQINPHFLYNTMDMINWLAQQGRTDEVSDAIRNLSRFYRLTLSQKRSISTIAQEEEHVSIYVRLQNMRFHDGITFIPDIPDELREYPIPKLTLQPVVENAILHGILESETKTGTIVLTGWMEDGAITLLISDDGIGMTGDQLANILSGSGSSSSGGTNIAIYNTHRRLQILYGLDYGLSYSSKPGAGTEVQIRIPAQKEYQSPYVHAADHSRMLPASPLISISDAGRFSSSVTPETLLEYSQKLTHNLYNIRNLHEISDQFSKNENLYILTHEVTADFPDHKHSYFEFNYVCSGSLINIVDGNEIYMEPGDLVFLNTAAVHSLKVPQKNTLLINFCLKPELFDRTLNSFYEDENPISDFLRGTHPEGRNYIFFALGHSLHAQSILASIIQEYAKNDFHQSFSLESWFLLLFSYLVGADEFSYYGVDSRTHQMIRYLTEHGAEVSAETAAAQFSLTTEQLDSHLKKHTGRTLSSFIQEARLNMALSLLADPALNIYQITESCGYSDADEFFEIFEKKYGVSPTEYRNQFL